MYGMKYWRVFLLIAFVAVIGLLALFLFNFWRSYTNEQCGYKLKYPFLYERSSHTPLLPDRIRIEGCQAVVIDIRDETIALGVDDRLDIHVFRNTSTMPLVEGIAKEFSKEFITPLMPYRQTLTINGHNAVKLPFLTQVSAEPIPVEQRDPDFNPFRKGFQLFIISADKGKIMWAQCHAGGSRAETMKLCDAILSTFQFRD